jgi:ribosomal protein L12E/L44/L45/RPP1/RPP2
MADEQQHTSSAEPSQPAAEQASAPASDAQTERPSGPPSWWQRLLGRQVQEESPPEPEQPAGAPPPGTVALTQEELDRRVQAETDRREAKRKAEAEREARRKLRDEDPWAYANEDRKAEEVQTAEQNMQTVFGAIGVEHDRVSIDPLVQALPEAERSRILALEGAGRGLDGRKLIVTEAMKALENHWKAEGAKDAEAKLRRNQAFRKQILAEIRGQSLEPELLPSGAASESRRSSDEINNMLRQQVGLATQ